MFLLYIFIIPFGVPSTKSLHWHPSIFHSILLPSTRLWVTELISLSIRLFHFVGSWLVDAGHFHSLSGAGRLPASIPFRSLH